MPRAKLLQIVWHAREGAKNEPILSVDVHPLHGLLALLNWRQRFVLPALAGPSA